MRHLRFAFFLTFLGACAAPSTGVTPHTDADASVWDNDPADRITFPGGRALLATLEFPELPSDAVVVGTISYAGQDVDYRHPERYRDMLVSPSATCVLITSLGDTKNLCALPDADGRIVFSLPARHMVRSREVLLASWDLRDAGPLAPAGSWVWVVPNATYDALHGQTLGDGRIADFDILTTALPYQVTVLPPVREFPSWNYARWFFRCGSAFNQVAWKADATLPTIVDTTQICSRVQNYADYYSLEGASFAGDTVQMQRIEVDHIAVPMRDGTTVTVHGDVNVRHVQNGRDVHIGNFETGRGVDVTPGRYRVDINYIHPETRTPESAVQFVDLSD